MSSFTFFDLASAVRQIRKLNFQTASANIIGIPTAIRSSSRNGRTWDITLSNGPTFNWDESNTQVPVISELASPPRTVARFGYFDLLAAMRSLRTLKFTTGGIETLAIPTSLMNHSRNSSVYTLTTTNGSFEWNDDNTSGPTVITQV